ncbi:hypothetical protein GN244_ATG11855 [Phytophthora infestans]|uniref:Uncharacterized protein n=1 Tax=Phytophthora infestans TaxID=4787 RepID=A0A833SNZ4_PHYIN|nr:hypothetical protein GN244_ATG11855 [Phytophthora infestans]
MQPKLCGGWEVLVLPTHIIVEGPTCWHGSDSNEIWIKMFLGYFAPHQGHAEYVVCTFTEEPFPLHFTCTALEPCVSYGYCSERHHQDTFEPTTLEQTIK